MLRYSCAPLLLTALFMLWYGAHDAQAAPTFGLLFARYNNNTTLLENILEAKINTLNVLARGSPTTLQSSAAVAVK